MDFVSYWKHLFIGKSADSRPKQKGSVQFVDENDCGFSLNI